MSDATQEQVASQVARAYLAAVKGDADVETAQANVTLSEALLKQSENEKEAGTGTGIEITRAKVQLANDRQRLLAAQNARHSAHLQLLRAMNLRLDTELELTDRLQLHAGGRRHHGKRQGAGLERAARSQSAGRTAKPTRGSPPAPPGWSGCPRSRRSATTAPSVPGSTIRCPRAPSGIQVKVPLFDGGRRDARREESASQYRAETVRTNDLKEQIELDVRLALDSLCSPPTRR